jgi:peptidoglycan/LPS O-acetylase OafA/YrhL
MLHIKGLDGFRGVAALIVMCAHFNGLFGITSGTLGVDLFFVLSGFLITSLLLTEIEQTGTVALGAFYLRRLLRLLPALFITVIVFGAIDLTFGIWPREIILKSMAATVLQYPSNWIRALDLWNMFEFGHTWSLAIEEQFYLFWPVALLGLCFVRSRPAIIGALAVLIVGLQINRYLAAVDGAPTVWVSAATHMRIDAIFIGCLAAFVSPYVKTNRLRQYLFPVAVAGTLLIVSVIIWRRAYYEWQQPLVVWSSAAILLHLAHGRETALHRALSVRWLTYTGRISYGLYLYHYPIWLLTVQKFGSALATDTKQLIGFFLLAPLSYAMAAASYRYVEAPALRLKSRFRADPTLGPARADPTPAPA